LANLVQGQHAHECHFAGERHASILELLPSGELPACIGQAPSVGPLPTTPACRCCTPELLQQWGVALELPLRALSGAAPERTVPCSASERATALVVSSSPARRLRLGLAHGAGGRSRDALAPPPADRYRNDCRYYR